MLPYFFGCLFAALFLAPLIGLIDPGLGWMTFASGCVGMLYAGYLELTR